MAPEGGAPLNFAAAAVKEKVKESALKAVQLDGKAMIKIAKHCKESLPALVTGQLLGLDVGPILEVTDCFPFPSRAVDEDDAAEADGASYQLDMMRCLREVNIDNNTVGWYQSTIMGSYQSVELIETFINYQETIKRCICIIFDPQRYEAGDTAIKAIRLRDSFIQVYKETSRDYSLTADKLKGANIAWKDVFEEIPIHIHNSPLIAALMAEISPNTAVDQHDYDKLSLSIAPTLEKNLEFLNECLDDTVMENQKISFYQRNVARQQQQQAQWLQKRKQENAARRAAGEEPLPEEDANLFKPIPEPSPLVNFLMTNQIQNYCEQLNSFSAQSLQKLHLMEALQKAHRV